MNGLKFWDLTTPTPTEEQRSAPLVLALGTFDGVHRGHVALLQQVLEMTAVLRKHDPSVRAGVWLFDPEPAVFLGRDVLRLTSLEEKLRLFAENGIETAVVADFAQLGSDSPQAFLEEVLKRDCRCIGAVCGFNFHFGYKGVGLPADLEAAFPLHSRVVDPVLWENAPVSSTRIRSALQEGDLEAVCAMLGRPFSFYLPVEHGQHLGRTLGIPTVNQWIPDRHAVPTHGSYVSRVLLNGHLYPAVSFVGVRPTVDGGGSDRVICETHLLDYSGDLYGQTLRVELLRRIRPETRFSGLQDLQAAIEGDLAATRAYFAVAPTELPTEARP